MALKKSCQIQVRHSMNPHRPVIVLMVVQVQVPVFSQNQEVMDRFVLEEMRNVGRLQAMKKRQESNDENVRKTRELALSARVSSTVVAVTTHYQLLLQDLTSWMRPFDTLCMNIIVGDKYK